MRMHHGAVALSLILGLVACDDDMGTTVQEKRDAGAKDATTPPPTPDATTPDDAGDAGADATGDAGPTLSARAEKGLAISPFPITTTGMSEPEREKLGYGSYLVNAAGGCNDCHAQALPNGPPKFLGGGTAFGLGPGQTVYARNLSTDSATGLKLTEAEFIEVMRTGKDFRNSGTSPQSLFVMPWPVYRWLTTADLSAMYAYLKKVPAVSNDVPQDIKGALANVPPTPFPATYNEGERDGGVPLPAEDAGGPLNAARGTAMQPLADPPDYATLTAAQKESFGRGAYLVNAAAGCDDCHTNPRRDGVTLKLTTSSYLSGGMVFDVPPPLRPITHLRRTMSANLTGATYGMARTFPAFRDLLTKGRSLGDAGYVPLGWPMPAAFKDLVDEDLQALYDYVTKVPRRTGANDKITQRAARYCASNTDCTGAGETCDLGPGNPDAGAGDAGPPATNECVGKTCDVDAGSNDCPVCQTCGSDGKCAAPLPSSTCLVNGR